MTTKKNTVVLWAFIISIIGITIFFVLSLGCVTIIVSLVFLIQQSFKSPLQNVKLWGYQIQNIDWPASSWTDLVNSHYDMLVIEPTRSDVGSLDFDAKGLVEELHNSKAKNVEKRTVIAYIDIGEAEDWRYYWKGDWIPPVGSNPGTPDFLICEDPDGWSGNYPVAYWDQRWKDIIIYNEDSSLKQVLDDGFDGIYMDWIEGYSNVDVVAAALNAGLNAADEMVKFIQEIKSFARSINPNFLIIAQNSPELFEETSFSYFSIIDGIAQEQWIFDGDADINWGGAQGGDMRIPEDNNDGYSTQWYISKLDVYKNNGIPVFTVNYCLNQSNVDYAYQRAAEKGYIEFVSQRSLSQLPSYTHPDYNL